jgi:hypothetical protein
MAHLKLSVKSRDAGKTEVGVERRVWKEERALWIDIKEEEVPTTDRTVERQVLAEIAKNLSAPNGEIGHRGAGGERNQTSVIVVGPVPRLLPPSGPPPHALPNRKPSRSFSALVRGCFLAVLARLR